MSQISTLAENGKKSQAGLVGRGFQAVAGGVWVDLFYAKSSCLFLLNYCQRFLRSNLFAGQCDERCLFLQGPLFILLITWRGTGRFFTRIGL
ncbi:hypothetical protein AM455_25900 [Klebsiella pneumoniae]|nr:hypothetical protein AM455_25900 [Klebsiella pneumoniae]HBX2153790.1 hypothetical protein [Klebsiella pneumoniae]HBX2169914.1 hypothetical protein [Klebsiella pneumoniae]